MQSLRLAAFFAAATLLVTLAPIAAASQVTARDVELAGSCSNGNLSLTLTTQNAEREYGKTSRADGATLYEFEQATGIPNFDGTVGWGAPFNGDQADGTIIGTYAYVGTTPPSPTTTGEFFVLYRCHTSGPQEVLLECFGPYGACPKTALEALNAPPPSTWVSNEVIDQDVPVPGAGPIPPTGVPILHVHGERRASDPRFYDISVSVLGGAPTTVGVNTNNLAAPPTVDAGLVEAGTVTADGYTVNARIVGVYDSSQVTCQVQVGTTCVAATPIDPAEASWITTEGEDAVLVVEVTVTRDDGTVVAAQQVPIPYAGQAAGVLP